MVDITYLELAGGFLFLTIYQGFRALLLLKAWSLIISIGDNLSFRLWRAYIVRFHLSAFSRNGQPDETRGTNPLTRNEIKNYFSFFVIASHVILTVWRWNVQPGWEWDDAVGMLTVAWLLAGSLIGAELALWTVLAWEQSGYEGKTFEQIWEEVGEPENARERAAFGEEDEDEDGVVGG